MKKYSVDDLYLHRGLQDMSARVDASRAVFVVSRARRKADTYRSTIWQLDLADDAPRARRLSSTEFDARSVYLDPAGRRVAFLSSRKPRTSAQVQLLPVDGGEARQLTNTTDPIKSLLGWSPDGKALLALQKCKWAEDKRDDVDARSRPFVVRHLPYKLDGSGPIVGFRTRLVRIEVAGGQPESLVEGDFDVAEAKLSPDGKRLAFSRKRGGVQRHQADLWLADADGGNARQVTSDLYSVSGLSFSPDGRWLGFAATCREGDSIMKFYLYDLEKRERLDPAKDAPQIEGATFIWDADSKRVATIAAIRGLFVPYIFDIPSREGRALDVGLRQLTALGATSHGLVFAAASVRRPDEIFRIGWDGTGLKRLTSFNAWVTKRERPRARKRRFDVPDGTGGTEKVEAWVITPPGGKGPFPLAADLHGGPQSVALIEFAGHVYWYELLARGWAIVAPNPVGSGSYGDDFARRLCGHWGEYDLPQLEAIVRALQDEGTASRKTGCYGKSYGGYLSAWAAVRSKLFDAAVVSAPVTNVQSHGGTSDTGYYVTPYAMKAELYEDDDVLVDLSPVQYAADVHSRVLLLQGQDDQRCPIGQSEEMLSNLVRTGCTEATMVVYPGGSHAMAASGKPSHRLDYHGRVADWLHTEA